MFPHELTDEQRTAWEAWFITVYRKRNSDEIKEALAAFPAQLEAAFRGDPVPLTVPQSADYSAPSGS